MQKFFACDPFGDRDLPEQLSLCDKILLASEDSVHYYRGREVSTEGEVKVQTIDTTAFWAGVESSDWGVMLSEGKRLLSGEAGVERVDVAIYVCIALEKTGKWLSLADTAREGVELCERYGVTDARFGTLLRALGRGLWDRQQYTLAADTYRRFLRWAEASNLVEEIFAAKYSIACCLEKLGEARWGEATALYTTVYAGSPNWPHRIAATVNTIQLLLRQNAFDTAYDLATTRFLQIPGEAHKGGSWVEFLRLLAQMEVYRGHPDNALMIVTDAIELVPEGRVAILAHTHAVRALAESALGNHFEAAEAMALAWSYAEQLPSADTCRLLKEVESELERR